MAKPLIAGDARRQRFIPNRCFNLVLCAAMLCGCKEASLPDALSDGDVQSPAAPPPADTTPVVARTSAQILSEFEATLPPMRNDEKLRELAEQADQIANISVLELGGSAVTDGGAEVLPQFTAVHTLTLSNSRVSGKALQYVAQMPALRVLHFDSVAIDDAALASLSAAMQLEELSLQRTGIGDAAFPALAELPTLRILKLSNNDRIMGHEFTKLVGDQRFLQLTELHADSTMFGYAGLDRLESLNQLQRLSVERSESTDESVADLKGCPSLVYLNLGNNKLTDEGLKSLTQLKGLEELHLQGNSAITDEGAARLRGLSALVLLNLQGTQCTLDETRKLKERSLQNATIKVADQEL